MALRTVKPLIKFVAVALALLVCGLLGWRLVRFLEIDSCLDSGGRYDYEANVCVLSEQG